MSITFDLETGMYRSRFAPTGAPHQVMDTSTSLESALAWCDRYRENGLWEEASDADEGRLMVSRYYKPGTVMNRMSRT